MAENFSARAVAICDESRRCGLNKIDGATLQALERL
jgi:hypothetical protein